MQKEKLLLLILAVVQFSHIVDFIIIMPLGAQLMSIFDISPQQFSFIVSIYAIAAFLSGLLGASFIDRFDRKHVLFVAFIGFTLGTLLCSATSSYIPFLIARALTGAFGGILSAMVLAVIGDAIPLERRGWAMGIVMTAFSVASVVGVPIAVYLAATFSWKTPFLVIGILAGMIAIAVPFVFPSMKIHLQNGPVNKSPVVVFRQIFTDRNQVNALLFSLILMLGHFTIVPFIAPYMQMNVGFSDNQVTYIYLVGGGLTVFFLPFFGKLSDRIGHYTVFGISSAFALFSIFAITNLPHVPLVWALCATSSFFVVASGRNVPATTLVTSVVKPESRGSFMSVRASVNEMALALSSLIAGMIIHKNADGSLIHYNIVGYFAIAMSLVAIWLGKQLKPMS
ncbi:MAG: MFS transporter [Saprospiraceae bacterium]|jgi:MFS transporter, DHA1 family, inner membrane transport protein|nr:MFS transporter [Saprospiraceae bacterium]MDP4999897.1 MFS transporter [Saprospiraceae bacterium]